MQVCEVSSTAWELILVTLWNITTQCAWYLLLHQLYTATISPFVSDHPQVISLPVVTAYVLPLFHLIGQSVNSLSTLPHIPHMLTSVPQTDRCCHHALYPQESYHCRDLFMPSHVEPSYQYPAKTILNILHFMHPLHYTQTGQDIQIHTVACMQHINFLFHMLWNSAHFNSWSITSVHLQASWKTFSHLHHSF